MTDDAQRPIIIRRKKKKGHQHHGGQWKIAYADFVTAMMAFFLLMWLLGSTARGDLQGIAEYFQTPLKIAMQGGMIEICERAIELPKLPSQIAQQCRRIRRC